mgnify:CR=1 FL=1
MDKILASITTRTLCLILFIYSNSICAGGVSKKDEAISIFSGLALVHHGLEFPPSVGILNLCKKNNDDQCLSVYNRAVAGKNMLLTMPHNSALKLTLNTIEKYCPEKAYINSKDAMCEGAFTSLFYFNSNEDDNEIIAFLKKQDMHTQELMVRLANAYDWPYNRANKSKWIDFFNSLSFISNIQKTYYQELFETKKIDFKINLLK